MVRNEGYLDRSVRVQLGGGLTLIAVLAWAMGNTTLMWVGLPGLILMVSGFVGFCPLYTVLGINTSKNDRK